MKIKYLKGDEKTLWFLEHEEAQKWFIVRVVVDFKGTAPIIRGCLSDANIYKLTINDLRATLNKHTKQNEIIKPLKEDKVVVQRYPYGNDDYLEVIFTKIIQE